MQLHYPEAGGKWEGLEGERDRCAYIILKADRQRGVGPRENKYIYIIVESRRDQVEVRNSFQSQRGT